MAAALCVNGDVTLGSVEALVQPGRSSYDGDGGCLGPDHHTADGRGTVAGAAAALDWTHRPAARAERGGGGDADRDGPGGGGHRVAFGLAWARGKPDQQRRGRRAGRRRSRPLPRSGHGRPARTHGVGAHDPPAGRPHDVRGVRVVPWLWGLPPNNPLYYPVYVVCVEAGVPLCTQIGHTGPLRRSEPGRPIPYLEEVLLDFPELVVVGGHVGFPWLDEVVSLTVKFPNFYVDTSAYTLARLPEQFVDHLRGPGGQRTMFGTNWPMLSPTQCLAGLDQLGLTAQGRESFLSGTAHRVFGL
ncbi:MAG: amidohydrolase family protein [Dermatophilaceae bacterium]